MPWDSAFFHYTDRGDDRLDVPRLHWQTIALGRDYYAALVSSGFRPRTPPHTHDFYEMMYVLEGRATHTINDRSSDLRPGDLIFIRPPDRHAVTVRPGSTVQFVNIAFPAGAWESFRALAGIGERAFTARSSAPPPAVRLPEARRGECATVFYRALHAFHEAPSGLELCGFWANVMPFLLQPSATEGDAGDGLPAWLRSACWAMRDARNLRAGLARFVEIGGVSAAHLSRTLKACRGQTPTEFINELRLKRAALLLTTTTREIDKVAAECGFHHLSYFYRLFGRRFGTSPRAYRLQARRSVVP